MFKDGINWVKKHPLSLVLIIGVGFLLLMLLSGGSSSSSAAATGQPDPNAVLQASTQLQLAQISADQNTNTVNAQLNAQDNATAASVALGQINANATNYQADLASKVALAQTQASEDVSMAGLEGQVQLAEIAASTNQAQIKATTDQAQIASGTYEALAHEQTTQVVSSYQTQADIAKTNAEQNVSLAQINGQTTQAVASAAAGAQKKQSDNGLLGGIIGGLFSLF